MMIAAAAAVLQLGLGPYTQHYRTPCTAQSLTIPLLASAAAALATTRDCLAGTASAQLLLLLASVCCCCCYIFHQSLSCQSLGLLESLPQYPALAPHLFGATAAARHGIYCKLLTAQPPRPHHCSG
jgi:hypothetical protein